MDKAQTGVGYELGSLIEFARPDLREIVFHSDGRINAKTGGKAKYPKKLYNGRTVEEAVAKLVYEREGWNNGTN